MSFPRSTGILLHPTSLPSRGGIGDFGPAAYEFLDFLAAAARVCGRCCPLGLLPMAFRPILPLPRLPEILSDQSRAVGGTRLAGPLHEPQDCLSHPRDRLRAGLRSTSCRCSAKPPTIFWSAPPAHARARFEQLLRAETIGGWKILSLFDALRRRYRPAKLEPLAADLWRAAKPTPLDEVRRELSVGNGCPPGQSNSSSTSSGMLCGSIARSDPSAWLATSRSLWTTTAPTSGPTANSFACSEDLEPEVVSGVPPDAFSATGQRWGNPLYNWDAIRAAGLRLVGPASALGHADLRLHPP